MSEYVKHIVKDGSRDHVIKLVGVNYQGKRDSFDVCSVANCEVNKRWDEYRRRQE